MARTPHYNTVMDRPVEEHPTAGAARWDADGAGRFEARPRSNRGSPAAEEGTKAGGSGTGDVEPDTWIPLWQAAAMVERAADVRLRPWRLRWTQALALTVLVTHGPQPISVLARYFLQQPQTMTDLIDHLAQRGLVQRTRHPSDRRVVLVEATRQGRGIAQEIDDALGSVLYAAFEMLDPTDQGQLRTTARRVRDRAADLAGVPPDHLRYAEEKLHVAPGSAAGETADSVVPEQERGSWTA